MKFRPGMSPAEYDQWRAEIDQMHRDYEAADQAEYEAILDELDARDAEQD